MIENNRLLRFVYGVFAILVSSCALYIGDIRYLIAFPIIALPIFTWISNKPHFTLLPNWITLLKLVLVIGLIYRFQSLNPLEITVLGFIIVLVDVLDGFVARKLNQTSKFGAVFDSEVDAFYVLVCVFGANFYFDMPVWVLLMGYIRYLYEIPLFFLNKRENPNPPKGRSIYAILAGIVFVLLALSFSMQDFQVFALYLASGILLFSFSKSFYHDFIATK